MRYRLGLSVCVCDWGEKYIHEAIPKTALLRMPIEMVPNSVCECGISFEFHHRVVRVLHNPLVMGETSATLSPLLMDIFQYFAECDTAVFLPTNTRTPKFHWFASKCIEMNVFPAWFLFLACRHTQREKETKAQANQQVNPGNTIGEKEWSQSHLHTKNTIKMCAPH